MKLSLLYSHLLYNAKFQKFSTLILTIKFILLVVCLPILSKSQIVSNSCFAIEPTFSDAPESTLCDLYENFTDPIFIGNGTSFPTSSQIGSSISGNVYINGNFVVNNTFTFNNCIVKIKPGTTILVFPTINNSSNLVIDNSKLFSCNNMWDGIVLFSNTSISTLNNTVIEDAIIAIKADNRQNCSLRIEKTTFNRNDTGIYLSQSTNISNPATIHRLSRNTFKCTAPLNGTVDQISTVGIEIQNNQILTVNPISEANYNSFIGLFRGILAGGFNTTISGKFFYFRACKYSGITINGILNLEASRFIDCGYAGIDIGSALNIKLSGCRFDFTENLIDYGSQFHRYGIFVYKFVAGSRFTVTKCGFNASILNINKNVIGIYFPNGTVESGAKININNNNFNYLAAWSFGIYMKGFFPSNSQIDIFNNVFHIQQVQNGYISFPIACIDGNKYNIDIIGNIFKNDGIVYNTQEGLYLRGSEGTGNEFTDNDFPLPVVFTAFEYGLRVENFDNTKFCSNTFYNTLGAFHFIGQNDVTNLISNNFHAVNILHVEENSWLDDQIQRGNTWSLIPNFPWVATPQALNETGDYAQYSEFLVHTDQSTTYSGPGFNPYHPVDIIPDVEDEWWRKLPGIPATNCITEEPPGGGVTKLKIDIADNIFESFETDTSLIWQAKRGLYRTLMKNPDLISLYSSFPSFLSNYANSTIGNLYNVSTKIDSALLSNEVLLYSIENKQNEIDSLLIELFKIDSILEITLDSLTLSIKNEIISQLFEIQQELKLYHLEYQVGLVEAIQNIRSLNDIITPTAEWENDEKVFYDIYLDFLEFETFREGQLDTLQSIANKCPKLNGMAVYFARGLLLDCPILTLSDDNDDCFQTQLFIEIDSLYDRSLSAVDILDSHISKVTSVFPNPTSGEIHIILPTNIPAEINITDYLGTVLVRHKIMSSQPLNLSSLESGIYLIHIIFEDKSSDCHKLVIIH